VAKKLTNYLVDLGRVVAYYPNLKKVTGSTTATILLCQLLYWSDKTKDGWIWKTAEEIEEETGLTLYEQQTAKRRLVKLGLIKKEFKRLHHTSRYKVNTEKLNKLWEDATGKPTHEIVEETKEAEPELEPEPEPEPKPKEEKPVEIKKPEIKTTTGTLADGTVITIENPDSKHPTYVIPVFDNSGSQIGVRKTAVKPLGDLVDGMIAFKETEAVKKINAKNVIRGKLEDKLHVNTDSEKWLKFIDFIYNRETKYGESVDKFLSWALDNGYNAIYWTPEKMKTLYPQAFIKDPEDDKPFCEPLPDFVEDESKYVPMPKTIGRKRDLFGEE